MTGEPAYIPPSTSSFEDYSTDGKFYKEIAWLEELDITTGWPDGTYRTLEPINRDAMVTCLWRFDKQF